MQAGQQNAVDLNGRATGFSLWAIVAFLIYLIVSFWICQQIAELPQLSSHAEWSGETRQIWTWQWMCGIFLSAVATIISIPLGSYIDAKRLSVSWDVLSEMGKLFSTSTIFQLSLGLISSSLIFFNSEYFYIFKESGNFYENFNLVRYFSGYVLSGNSFSVAYILLLLSLIAMFFFAVIVDIRLLFRSSSRPTARPELVYEGSERRFFEAVRDEKVKIIRLKTREWALVLALFLNNYFVAPALPGSYQGIECRLSDPNILKIFAAQLIAAGFLLLCLKQVKSASNLSVIYSLSKSIDLPSLRVKLSKALVFLLPVLAVTVVLVSLYAWNITSNSNNDASSPQATHQNTISSLTCSVTIDGRLTPLGMPRSSKETIGALEKTALTNFDIRSCRLTNPLTTSENFAAIIETGDDKYKAMLAVGRAELLAEAILSQAPGWRGRLIVINTNTPYANANQALHGPQRPIVVLTGYVPLEKVESTGWRKAMEALKDDAGLSQKPFPNPDRTLFAALSSVQELKEEGLLDLNRCTFETAWLQNGDLARSPPQRCSDAINRINHLESDFQ